MSTERNPQRGQPAPPQPDQQKAPPGQQHPASHQPGQQKPAPSQQRPPRLDDKDADEADADKRTDRDLVGQDTDGDGKVVKPGQAPGQSQGRGLKP